MNKDDLRDVEARLEALESLTKLFKNLWFGHIKGEIQDEKTKAYLMVFDDAFPGIDHVIEFVRKNISALSSGDKVQDGFEMLTQSLLNRQIDTDLNQESTADEPEVLETIGQGDVDALFVAGSEDAPDTKASKEEMVAFLADDAEDEEHLLEDELKEEKEADLEDLLGADDTEEAVDDLEDIFGDEEDAVDVEGVGEEDEADLEDLLGYEEDVDDGAAYDLEDLLGDEDQADAPEEEQDDIGEDLADLLGEDDDDDDDDDDKLDITELLDDEEEDGVSAEVSEEEMTTLLGDDDEEGEEQQRAELKPRTKTKKKAKKAEAGENELDDAVNGEESVKQGEIDALFG